MSEEPSSSMCWWWPRICDMGVPQPKTIMVPMDMGKHGQEGLYAHVEPEADSKDWIAPHLPQLRHAARILGWPVFMRSDATSGKHEWDRTCRVESETDIVPHLLALFEFHLCCDIMGLPLHAVFFREWIAGEPSFTAFRGTPIRPEIRIMVTGDTVDEWFPYWPLEAFQGEEADRTEQVKDLDAFVAEHANTELMEIACAAARRASAADATYWSVDFLWASDQWWLIDMARGEQSWRPSNKPPGRKQAT